MVTTLSTGCWWNSLLLFMRQSAFDHFILAFFFVNLSCHWILERIKYLHRKFWLADFHAPTYKKMVFYVSKWKHFHLCSRKSHLLFCVPPQSWLTQPPPPPPPLTPSTNHQSLLWKSHVRDVTDIIQRGRKFFYGRGSSILIRKVLHSAIMISIFEFTAYLWVSE